MYGIPKGSLYHLLDLQSLFKRLVGVSVGNRVHDPVNQVTGLPAFRPDCARTLNALVQLEDLRLRALRSTVLFRPCKLYAGCKVSEAYGVFGAYGVRLRLPNELFPFSHWCPEARPPHSTQTLMPSPCPSPQGELNRCDIRICPNSALCLRSGYLRVRP